MKKKNRKTICRKGVSLLAAAALSAVLLGGQVYPAFAGGSNTAIEASALIPDNVTIDSPTALSNVSLPKSDYGKLSWSDSSYVPSQRVQSCEVVFKPAGGVDLSHISGWDSSSGTITGYVTVVVNSISDEDKEEDYSEDDYSGDNYTEDESYSEEEPGDNDYEVTEDQDTENTDGPENTEDSGEAESAEDEDKAAEGENSSEDVENSDEAEPAEDEDKASEGENSSEDSENPDEAEPAEDEEKASEGESSPEDVENPDEAEPAEGEDKAPEGESSPEDIENPDEAESAEGEDKAPEGESNPEDIENPGETENPEDTENPEAGQEGNASEPADGEEAPPDSETADGEEEPDASQTPEETEPEEDKDNIFDRPEELDQMPDERPADAEDTLTEEEMARRAEENHSCNGIYVSGIELPWYVQFRVSGGEAYEFTNETSAEIFKSYEFELWDLKNNTEYKIPDGQYISVTVPVKAGYEYSVEHLLDNGAMETIIPSVDNGTMVFSTHSFSPFGIAGSKPLVGGEIAEHGYSGATATPAPTKAVTPTKAPASTAGSGSSGNTGGSSSSGSSGGGSNGEQSYSGQTQNTNGGSSTSGTSGSSVTKGVNTGDDTNIMGFVILVIVAAAAGVVVIYLKKKKK